ncbi:MAG: ethanolamine utilization protein EutN [Myxococcota bacterium]|jgi:ethanolamine utilization protein EutN
MILARVIGNVVSTAKHPTYQGRSVMIVQPLDEAGDDDGDSFLAVDNSQAGPGDRVLVLSEGGGIRQILGIKELPIRRLIVGIVDSVHAAPTKPRKKRKQTS